MSVFHDILKQYWGYDSFRSLQEEIIASVASGKDTLGLMPTGGGKSLTFQVPALAMEGICIVVTPLIALMKDQVDNLRAKGIKATTVHSGMSREEILVALDNCIYGDYKFLYVSPERLGTELFLSRLQYMNVCLLAVDESHCISQWGYDFRPSYMTIADVRQHLPGVPLLALTATATPEVVDDIQDRLLFKEKNVFKKSFERKNLAYVVRQTADKMFEIINILNHVPGSALVYVRSRKRTKEIAEDLIRRGMSADFFHAGLNRDEKTLKQNRWKSGECRIMVCTNAFGMGIDKPDVRVVIHFELPGSLEEYFQEAGRAGRDGQKSFAVALVAPRDQANLKRRIKDEFPDRAFISDVYEKLAYFFQIGINSGIHTAHNFSIEQFCHVFHYNMTQTHHALKLLELSGYIVYLEEADKQSKVYFTTRRDDLYYYSGLDAKTDELLKCLLRSYTGLFSDYVYINENLLATRTGQTHHQVYEQLKFLSAQQIIHYVPAQKVPMIIYAQSREDIKHLTIPRSVYEDRKDRLAERIEKVLEYGSSLTTCRSRQLLAYFGEKKSADCGHCEVCLAKKKQAKRAMNSQEFETIRLQVLERLSDGLALPVGELIREMVQDETDILNVIRYLADCGELKIDDDKVSIPQG